MHAISRNFKSFRKLFIAISLVHKFRVLAALRCFWLSSSYLWLVAPRIQTDSKDTFKPTLWNRSEAHWLYSGNISSNTRHLRTLFLPFSLSLFLSISSVLSPLYTPPARQSLLYTITCASCVPIFVFSCFSLISYLLHIHRPNAKIFRILLYRSKKNKGLFSWSFQPISLSLSMSRRRFKD